MESEIIKQMFLKPPDEWVLLEDTVHALRYAAEIWKDEPKLVQLNLQYNQIKDLYDEYYNLPDHDLDQMAQLAFQIQFLRECVQEIKRLTELSKGSPYG